MDDCIMLSVFGTGENVCIWFNAWHITTTAQYWGTVIFIIVFCFIRELAAMYRVTRRANQERERQKTQHTKHVLLSENGAATKQAADEASSLELAYDSFLYTINMILAYLLMLLIMTYNVGICLVVVAGSFLAHFSLSYYVARVKKQPAPYLSPDHCCEAGVSDSQGNEGNSTEASGRGGPAHA